MPRRLNARRSGHCQANLDVVAGGVGIRTDLMDRLYQPPRVLARDPGQLDDEISGDTETPFGTRADSHGCRDCGVARNTQLELLTGDLQRCEEAGGIAGRKKLLRVRS